MRVKVAIAVITAGMLLSTGALAANYFKLYIQDNSSQYCKVSSNDQDHFLPEVSNGVTQYSTTIRCGFNTYDLTLYLDPNQKNSLKMTDNSGVTIVKQCVSLSVANAYSVSFVPTFNGALEIVSFGCVTPPS